MRGWQWRSMAWRHGSGSGSGSSSGKLAVHGNSSGSEPERPARGTQWQCQWSQSPWQWQAGSIAASLRPGNCSAPSFSLCRDAPTILAEQAVQRARSGRSCRVLRPPERASLGEEDRIECALLDEIAIAFEEGDLCRCQTRHRGVQSHHVPGYGGP